MGSCGKSTMLDDASGGSVISQHSCPEFPLQSIPVQRSCSVVTSNALDSNVDHSNVLEGCMDTSAQVHTGSASTVDFPETSKDSILVVRKNENADMLLLEKASDIDIPTYSSMSCEQIEVSNLESFGLNSEQKPDDKDSHEMPSEFILTRVSPKNCVQHEGQEDEKSNIVPSRGESLATTMVDENDASLPIDACNHITIFKHSGTSLESESVNGLLVDCCQQSEQVDIMRNADPWLEVANKCELLSRTDTDTYKHISSSQCSEVPVDGIYTELKSISDRPLDQKDGEDDTNPCADSVDKESISDPHVQVLSSTGCQKNLGKFPTADSTDEANQLEQGIDKIEATQLEQGIEKTEATQLEQGIEQTEATQLEQGMDKIDIGLNSGDVTKAIEQNYEIMNEINVEMKCSVLQVDDNACKLNDNSSDPLLSSTGCQRSLEKFPTADSADEANQLEQDIDKAEATQLEQGIEKTEATQLEQGIEKTEATQLEQGIEKTEATQLEQGIEKTEATQLELRIEKTEATQLEQGMDKIDIGLNSGDVTKAIEQKYEIMNEINVEMKCSVLQEDDNACKLNDNSSDPLLSSTGCQRNLEKFPAADSADEANQLEQGIDKAEATQLEQGIEKTEATQLEQGIEKTEATQLEQGIEKTEATQLEQGMDKIDIGLNSGDVTKATEQNSEVLNEINVEMKCSVLQVDDNICQLNDNSTETDANCPLRKTITPESVLPSVGKISNSSSKDVPQLLTKGDNDSIGYDSIVGNSGQADSTIEVDCIPASKRFEVATLPFQRNNRRSKSNHKTQTKRASRKCKSKANVPLIILEAARKKRSCFSKPARSSIWGLEGNINKFFEQVNEVGVNEVMCQGLGKARGACKRGKANKNGAISSSVSSMKKCSASTTRVRLKIKLGKEVDLSCSNVLVPEISKGSGSASSLVADLGSQKVGSNAVNKLSEEVAMGELESFKNNLDKDALELNGQIANNHSEGTASVEKSDEIAEELCFMIPLKRMDDPLREAINNKGMDPGTSPDSEVINSMPEVQPGERHQQGVHDAMTGSSKEFNSIVEVASGKRGKKKNKLSSPSSCIDENGLQGPPRKNKAKHSKNRARKKNSNDVFPPTDQLAFTDMNAARDSLSCKELSSEPLAFFGEIELKDSTKVLKVRSSLKVKTTCSPDVDHELLESQGGENSQSSARSFGRKLPKSLKSSKISKTKSKASDSMSRKKAGSRRREKQQKPLKKSEVNRIGDSEIFSCEVKDHLHTENGVNGNYKLDAIGNVNAGDDKVSVNVSNLDMALGVGLVEQHLIPHNAWVRCDDCHKWRRIPVELADLIEETKSTWTCKDSDDKAFADCSIPQEKSNAEINAELGLSEASGEEDAHEDCKNYKELGYRQKKVYQESTFTHILTNEFQHRSRKNQTIDEIMVCHCKSPSEGRFGCGDECLNRMLNIECVHGTCPCGDRCSNQQFQQRKYSSLTWFKCGKKGYGLKALEDISKGQFLIEYVGEVLDVHAYEARQREYAFKGHRHFYFMTLNGSEVIDASAKGNLGRFINHSCDPNCRTEKWMVNGEICIGLFALRDIKQDEEVTFDYNYVRVFGAAAKKCYCGSPLCRGYIGGGDPLSVEVIVQGDSDEEFPEPVMLNKYGLIDEDIPRSNVVMQTDRKLLKDRDLGDKPRSALVTVNNQEKENSINPASAISQLHCSSEVEDSVGKLPSSVHVEEISQQMEDLTCKSMLVVQQANAVKTELPDKTSSIQRSESSSTTTISKVVSNVIKSDRESKSEMVEERPGFPKSSLLVKTSRHSGSVKKGKVHADHLNGLKDVVTTNKLQLSSTKPKKVMEGSSNGRFEAVQEKLKELLDEDGEGGISKRKDATKGYLKLLLLTVASGDRNNGEAIQSNRDLSMILGALLKTKSRAVLNDIINKNGLQMLHNILKQYRRDFKKTPILRKLLKVLEHLAASKILTFEHINSSPPCRGMESFRESMLSLTEHDDKQVHQIARSFRDRWIPRALRKHVYMDRDDYRTESHRSFSCNRFSASHSHRRDQDTRPIEAIDCVQQSSLVTTSADTGTREDCSAVSLDESATNGTKRRKRKSRWDQPAETISDSASNPFKKQNIDSGLLMQTDAVNSFDGSQNIAEDFPPGFSCPVQPQLGSMNASPHAGDLALQNAGNSGCLPSTVVIGHPKEKFNSCMSVSYGIPLSLVQQYGTLHSEIAGSWVTAPGMPFSPFPPLPPYPRDKKDPQPSLSANAVTVDQPAEVQQLDMSSTVSSHSEDTTPSTTSPEGTDLLHEDDKQISKRMKGSPPDLGRRYFRQQKWNNSKIHRPWFRKNAWGCSGNNTTTGGICSIGVGDELSESKVTCSSEDVICRVEKDEKNV